MRKCMTLAVLAVLSLSFTSCEDNDEEIAYTLEGTWRGDMYVSAEYDGTVYDATYSEICFVCDPHHYSSGTGYWVDHYSDAGWGRNHVVNHIEWKVNNESIKVYFVEEKATVFIENYRLDDKYFTGTIHDGDNYVDFSLRHITSPNWDYYFDDYAKEDNTWTRANTDAEPVAAPKRIFRTNK